jgi:hypothetical protein
MLRYSAPFWKWFRYVDMSIHGGWAVVEKDNNDNFTKSGRAIKKSNLTGCFFGRNRVHRKKKKKKSSSLAHVSISCG